MLCAGTRGPVRTVFDFQTVSEGMKHSDKAHVLQRGQALGLTAKPPTVRHIVRRQQGSVEREGDKSVSWPCAPLTPGEGKAQTQIQMQEARTALMHTGRLGADHEEMKTSQGFNQEATCSEPSLNQSLQGQSEAGMWAAQKWVQHLAV